MIRDMAFDFSLIKEAIVKKRSLVESKQRELENKMIGLLPKMKAKYGVCEVYLFGSLIKPKGFTKNSDLDVAVLGLKNEYFFKFMAELQESVGSNVDLIELERCRFKERIRKEGIKVE